MESRLPITDDVLETGIIPSLNFRAIANFTFTTKHHFHLFSSPNFWQKLITDDFGIAANVLKEFTPTLNYQLIYKRLELLKTNKNLSKKIRDFCRFPSNYENLLVCLSNRADLLHRLPIREDSIWLEVALAADCPHVYQLIFNRHPHYQDGFDIALELGNLAAVKWMVLHPLLQPLKFMYVANYGRRLADLFRSAVSSDNPELLVYLHEQTKQFHFSPRYLFSHAVKEGSVSCATWLKSWCEKSGIRLEINYVDAVYAAKRAEMIELIVGQADIYSKEGMLHPFFQRAIANSDSIKDIVLSKHREFIRLMFATPKTTGIINYGLDWPLKMAAISGCVATMQLVFENTIGVIIKGGKLIEPAVKDGNFAMVRYLVGSHFPAYFVELTKDEARRLLREAFESGNGDLVQYLIENITKQTHEGQAVISDALLTERVVSQNYFDATASIYNSLRHSFKHLYNPDAAIVYSTKQSEPRA